MEIKFLQKKPFYIFTIENFLDDSEYQILEENFGVKAIKNFEPMQPGDVEETYADTKELFKWIGFSPETSLEEGLKIFSEWYLNFYKNNFK